MMLNDSSSWKVTNANKKNYIAIIEFSIYYYESCLKRSIDDYIKRTGRDIKSE